MEAQYAIFYERGNIKFISYDMDEHDQVNTGKYPIHLQQCHLLIRVPTHPQIVVLTLQGSI